MKPEQLNATVRYILRNAAADVSSGTWQREEGRMGGREDGRMEEGGSSQPSSLDVPLMARNTWREFCSSERIMSSGKI